MAPETAASYESRLTRLVLGGPVADRDEADDLLVADAEVVGEDQRVWEVSLVVVAVIGGADDRVTVVIDHFGDVHCDVVADDLLGHKRADRVQALNLAAYVVDEGVRFIAAPNAYAPTMQVSGLAWQSSKASPKHTTEPSPSPPAPPAGSASRCNYPPRTYSRRREATDIALKENEKKTSELVEAISEPSKGERS